MKFKIKKISYRLEDQEATIMPTFIGYTARNFLDSLTYDTGISINVQQLWEVYFTNPKIHDNTDPDTNKPRKKTFIVVDYFGSGYVLLMFVMNIDKSTVVGVYFDYYDTINLSGHYISLRDSGEFIKEGLTNAQIKQIFQEVLKHKDFSKNEKPDIPEYTLSENKGKQR